MVILYIQPEMDTAISYVERDASLERLPPFQEIHSLTVLQCYPPEDWVKLSGWRRYREKKVS